MSAYCSRRYNQQTGEYLSLASVPIRPLTEEEEKQALGERIYEIVVQTQPQHAGKITGMIIESRANAELVQLLASASELAALVKEAEELLRSAEAELATEEVLLAAATKLAADSASEAPDSEVASVAGSVGDWGANEDQDQVRFDNYVPPNALANELRLLPARPVSEFYFGKLAGELISEPCIRGPLFLGKPLRVGKYHG